MKICRTCKNKKEYNNFFKDKTQRDGYCSECKVCRKQYKLDNKIQINKTTKIWRKDNKEKTNKYTKKWRNNNPEKYLDIQNNWKNDNPNYFKNYRKTHKKEHSEYIYKYNKKKAKEDPLFKIKCNLGNRLRRILKTNNWNKDNETLKIIGCSKDELKWWLEFWFEDGMTWENYSKWEIDHIKPLSLAKTKKELYKLNHYINLQPLWKYDNIKKSNKYE